MASSSARQVHGRDSSFHPCWSWAGQDQVTTWLGLASPSGANAEAGAVVSGRCGRAEQARGVVAGAEVRYHEVWVQLGARTWHDPRAGSPPHVAPPTSVEAASEVSR